MPSYDWQNYQVHWLERYPHWVRGATEWANQQPGLPGMLNLLSRLQSVRMARPPAGPPRLFVSHRQSDRDEALRIAWLADQEGFEFWIDVLDPNLALLQSFSGSLPPKIKGVATACIIEMALLNCSHILAVMTNNTVGSKWVPYEYGRVKQPTILTMQAGSWVERGVKDPDLPEYLHLGPVTRNEAEITAWLGAEFAGWNPPGSPVPAGNWMGPIPAPL